MQGMTNSIAGPRSIGCTRIAARLALKAGLLLFAIAALAQDMPSPSALIPNSAIPDYDLYSAQETATSDTRPSQNGTDQINSSPRSASSRENDAGTSTILSANQIIVIMHQKPEVVVDLKHVMADYFAKHGIAVQEDSITDEMLFSNIATNADLRRSVSTWLRVRGYASDADFDQSTETSMTSEPMQTESSERDGAPADDSDGRSQLALALRNLPSDSEVMRDYELGSNPDSRSALDSSSTLGNRSVLDNSSPLSNKRESAVYPAGTTRKADDTTRPLPIRREPEKAPTDSIEVLHQTAPYNLQSLRDLYTQVPEQTDVVKRFGADVFLSRGMATMQMPIDLPIGPDYVLGPGDGLTISLWGGVSQTFTRIIDREGSVVLPEAGSTVVAGLTLERAQELVQGELSPQFKDAHVAVSVTRLRTVRVYVVGDVQRPGAYDISSLSTPLNALYAAGGPTRLGSLRTVRHYRGSILIREVDLYDFLLHGVRADVERLEPGDTILVPAAGPQVEVSGMVKRPAIYEFKGEIKLSDVLDESGGVRVSAALAHIRVERIEADGHRSTLEVGLPQGSTLESARARMSTFVVKDGDRVIVAPILPYSERAIYLSGHVVRPGKLPYFDSMKLSDAIHSYQELLPEPSDHGEIVRLMPPDFHPQAIDFSVAEVLTGSTPIFLQPFDTRSI
jgi:protein involved in polysaccharide export with SLBB domain